MDLTYPKLLAKETLQYSPPQVDNRFINADSWLFYKLGRYASQFPKFQQFREDIFDEISDFLDSLDNDDDVQNIFTNLKIGSN